MSSLIIRGDTSGAITLSAPNAAGDSTYTLPAVNGSVMVSGNIPAFRVYPASNQTINHSTTTKISWGTEDYDTNNCFASDRFTPNVAGYYQLNMGLDFATTNGRNYYIENYIYKNGSRFSSLEWSFLSPAQGNRFTCSWSDIVYCNGSTDYIEIYSFPYDYTASSTVSFRIESVFSGSLVRTA